MKIGDTIGDKIGDFPARRGLKPPPAGGGLAPAPVPEKIFAVLLPYPPSTNRLTRTGNGRAYASPQAKAWKQQAAWLARQSGSQQPMAGEARVEITLHPKANRDGRASKTRVDIDNAIKAALDALNGIAWHDDRQVVHLTAMVGNPLPDGGLTVGWEAA